MSEADNTAVQESKQGGALALATLNPAQYVTEAFSSFEAKLAAAIEVADSVVIDCTTTAGMEASVKQRAIFRDDYRLKIESTRTDIKAPILEIGKLIDARAKDLTAKVLPYEERFDKAIKAEQQRKAEEKRLREEAERAKVAAIMADIQFLRDIAISATGKSSADILVALGVVEALEVTEQRFGSFTAQASIARAETIDRLQVMQRAALEAEEAKRAAAEAAERDRLRIAAEQEELARQRAEQARIAEEQRKESERLAELQRQQEADARRVREEYETKAKADEAERKRVADEQAAAIAKQAAELQRQRDAFAAEMAEAEAARRRHEEAAKPAPEPEPAPAPVVNTAIVADELIAEAGAQLMAGQITNAKEEIYWSLDGENFTYGSLKELLETYQIEAGRVVHSGTALHPELKQLVDAESVIEMIGERAFDIGGEWAEDYPDVTKEAEVELQELLEAWLAKHCRPTFYQVVNIKQHTLTAADLA